MARTLNFFDRFGFGYQQVFRRAFTGFFVCVNRGFDLFHRQLNGGVDCLGVVFGEFVANDEHAFGGIGFPGQAVDQCLRVRRQGKTTVNLDNQTINGEPGKRFNHFCFSRNGLLKQISGCDDLDHLRRPSFGGECRGE